MNQIISVSNIRSWHHITHAANDVQLLRKSLCTYVLTPKLSKMHNGLYHHISIFETVRKNIWIITFGAQMKKTIFRRADLAKTGLAQFPKPARSDFMIFQLPHMEECTAPLHFSRRANQKIYFDRLIWTPDKLTTIFWRFTALDLRNRPGRFWKQAMWAMSIDGVLGSWLCDF